MSLGLIIHQEIYDFLREKRKGASMLKNKVWISELAFCVDILEYMNDFNIKL